MNLYAYVGNGVVNKADPSGRLPVLGAIVGKLLAGCAVGIAGDVMENIGRWLVCTLTNMLRGAPADVAARKCGPFPAPTLCDLIAGCLGGIVGGPVFDNLLPPPWREKLKEEIRELVGGFIAGGICDALSQPLPPRKCPKPSKPSPVPPGHRVLPPGEVLPGECITLPNGRVVCG